MNWKFENGHIYSTDSGNNLLAELTYEKLDEHTVEINHTFVDPSLRGQGIAGQMMEAAMAYFRKEGLKVTASCSYAKAWLEKNV